MYCLSASLSYLTVECVLRDIVNDGLASDYLHYNVFVYKQPDLDRFRLSDGSISSRVPT